METKKIGEDWIFFFSLKNESGSLIDLNGYEISVVVEKRNKVEILREKTIVTQTAQEFIKTIPASLTKTLDIGEYSIEYELLNLNGNTFITNKVLFQVVSTLHYN